jgi:hypothetical protein
LREGLERPKINACNAMNFQKPNFIMLPAATALVLAGLLQGCATGGRIQNRAATPSATVAVDAKSPGAAVPADFIGLSFEASQLFPNAEGVHYFRPDNRPLIRLFHTLGVKSLRIGGNTSDRDAKQLPDEADLDSLFAFAKAADVKVIYCLRLHDGDPQADAQTVKYIMDRYAPLVECFSIGQEPSAYPTEQRDTRARTERMGAANEKYQYSQYREEWKKFADAILAAVPEAKFCGPSVHNNGGWARTFMSDFGKSNHVVLVTEHLYPGGSGNKVPTPEIGIDRMLASNSEMTNSFPRVYQKLHASFVPMAVSNGLAYRLEEVNNYFNGGAANVSNTYASALWGLDFLWWWAEHGAAGLNFHTGDKVAAGYTLRPSKYTAFFTATNGFYVRPLGYGIKAFELGSRGKILPVEISGGSSNFNLAAYAVLGEDKTVYLTLINKAHGAAARELQVAVGTSPVGYARGEIIYLTAPDNDAAATAGVMLGDAAINNDARWNGAWKNLAPAGKAKFPFTVELPPASAAVVKLTPK